MNLRTTRDAIDHYTLDKERCPKSLQDLVDAGYLRAIPVDPMTGRTDWVPDFDGPVLADPVVSPYVKAQGFTTYTRALMEWPRKVATTTHGRSSIGPGALVASSLCRGNEKRMIRGPEV